MEIVASRQALLSAIGTAAAFCPSRSPKPVLGMLRIETTDTGVEFTGNSLDRACTTGVDCEVHGSGSVLVSAERLLAVMRASDADDVRMKLTLKGGSPTGLHIEAGAAELSLSVQAATEFPLLMGCRQDKASTIEVPSRAFRQAIKRTVFAADTESGRFALAGLYLDVDDTGLTLVGSDGRRASAVRVADCRPNGQKWRNCIVPAETMHHLERGMSGGDTVFISVDDDNNDRSCVEFKCGSVWVASRLLQGRFPRWRDIVPNRNGNTSCAVTAGKLAHAIQQASIVCDKERRAITVKTNGVKVEVDAQGEYGTAQVSMVAQGEPREPVESLLDHRYLSQYLNQVDAFDTVRLDVLDADSAVLLTDDNGGQYVLMPMAKET